MTDADPKQQPEESREILKRLMRRVRALTVAVVLMALALFVLAASIFGYLVDWHAFDPVLYGGAAAGCALLGFAFGWFAGRSA